MKTNSNNKESHVIFHSLSEWKKQFLGRTTNQDYFDTIKNNPSQLGDALADKTIDNILDSKSK